MAAMTLNHSCQVCFFSPSDFVGEKGLSLWKNRTITARIAPSWMTTSNMLRNASETFRVINSFSKIRCPVEEMGSHSVTPSTMPKSTAFNSSIKSVSFFHFKESMNKSPSAEQRIFFPAVRFRKRESRLTDAAYPLRVHKGFLRFRNLHPVKNLSLSALVDLFMDSLGSTNRSPVFLPYHTRKAPDFQVQPVRS